MVYKRKKIFRCVLLVQYPIKSISKVEEIIDQKYWRWPWLDCVVLRPNIVFLFQTFFEYKIQSKTKFMYGASVKIFANMYKMLLIVFKNSDINCDLVFFRGVFDEVNRV